MSARITAADFPDKLKVLFEPKRYKVLYGGRGAAKSWGVARALLIRGAQKPTRILCAREIQKSIADSVHQLLSDQVRNLGLENFYKIQNNEIIGKNGTEFTFHGLKHNIANIKSVEGTDILWVEEAQNVSKSSWNTAIPTIRKEGSEIWITFNPELEEDETFQRFVLDPPPNAFVVKVNWSDNPWFPKVLDEERLALKERDPNAYENVWEGHCKQVIDGAIYAEQLRQATADGRITRVPYDPTKPVSTFWDLGLSDMTTIWMGQIVGLEFRFIDYLQSNSHAVSWYVAELQKRPYSWGDDFIPHDGKHKQQAAAALPEGQRTIEGQLRSLGRKPKVMARMGKAESIAATRAMFPRCYFDREKCADGLQALRHYQYAVDPDTGKRSQQPEHNWASHGADALAIAAWSMKSDKPKGWAQPSTKWVV